MKSRLAFFVVSRSLQGCVVRNRVKIRIFLTLVFCGLVSTAFAKEDLFGKGATTFSPGPETTLINFDDGLISAGAKLDDEYASRGVLFTAGHSSSGVINPIATSQPFGTVSPMTIAVVGGDVGGGLQAPIAGNLLHSFSSWLVQDGDPSFTMDFSFPVDAVSIDVGGISTPESTALYAIDGSNNVLGSVVAASSGTVTLSLAGLGNFQRAVVTMGDIADWVGVDNLAFNVVPEPCGVLFIGLVAFILCVPRRTLRERPSSKKFGEGVGR